MLRGSSRWAARLVLAVATMSWLVVAPGAASAAGSGTADQLADGLGGLVTQLSRSSLTAAERARVHAAKEEVIVAAYDDEIGGISGGRVIIGLDCVSLNLQRARNATKRSVVRARIAAARACRADLAQQAGSGGARGLLADLGVVNARLKSIATRAAAGRAFGAEATALRTLQRTIIGRRFGGQTLHGVPFGQVYENLECIDVKVESGRASGALSCAKRLLRRSKALAPVKDPVTFGSDLSGTPVALPTTFPAADTEFWTSALTVPVAGRITAFRLRTGNSPIDLPLRFSVVRPRDDGKVVVVTTTDPVFPLAAHDPGLHTYPTSAVNFTCCKVQAGDIVTVDNSGTTTAGAYVWFAERPGTTTFSNTGYGDSQNAGVVWEGTPHPGYDVLLQVVLQPD